MIIVIVPIIVVNYAIKRLIITLDSAGLALGRDRWFEGCMV